MSDRPEPRESGAGRDAGGRYFFAVWPNAAVRRELAAWSRDIQAGDRARPVATENLHMTLVFLGTLDDPRLEAVRKVADAARPVSARMVLDRIGYWRRPGIIWAGTREEPEPLTALVATLRDGLRRFGFRVDERRFTPHVTLFRKAGRRPKWRPRLIEWPVQGFCLVRSHLSEGGSRYEVLHHWSVMGDME